ncbi:MAG: DUF427 domain-containing protein [Pseudomonadota bacterium]
MSIPYRLQVDPVPGTVTARLGARPVARSDAAKVMHETRLAPALYFPRTALQELTLVPSERRTFCPFKGTATYWHADLGDARIEDGVWSYERTLPEARPIEGMLGLMPTLADGYDASAGLPARTDDGHISGPLVDWIMREATNAPDMVSLTRQLGERFVANGIAVSRLSVLVWSLDPQIAGTNAVWRRDSGEVEIRHPRYETLETPAFANSPLRHVAAGRGGVRQLLTVAEPEFDFPILEELRAGGATDYVAMPLPFAGGMTNVMTLASDHPAGFTTANLGLIFECAGAISRFFEVQALQRTASALLGTYVGPRTGARVLGGEIRRGDGDDIEAAILYADLRGSTRLAESLPRDAYLALLNGFFDAVAEAVAAEEGEVLKFIGDAVLAVFAVEEDGAAAACRRAARAAAAIPDAVRALALEGGPANCAIGVSFGQVTYGNVGARDRLDFTVIGHAANLAARLSDLGKALDQPVLMTKEVANATEEAEALGPQRLHNVRTPVEVFASVPQSPALTG